MRDEKSRAAKRSKENNREEKGRKLNMERNTKINKKTDVTHCNGCGDHLKSCLLYLAWQINEFQFTIGRYSRVLYLRYVYLNKIDVNVGKYLVEPGGDVKTGFQ